MINYDYLHKHGEMQMESQIQTLQTFPQYSLTKCFPMFHFNFGSRKMFPVNEDYYLGWKHI